MWQKVHPSPKMHVAFMKYTHGLHSPAMCAALRFADASSSEPPDGEVASPRLSGAGIGGAAHRHNGAAIIDARRRLGDAEGGGGTGMGM